MSRAEAIAAAVARMGVRARGEVLIEWRSYQTDRCTWCKSKTALLVYYVRPVRLPERRWRPAERYSKVRTECFDQAACKARRDKAYESRPTFAAAVWIATAERRTARIVPDASAAKPPCSLLPNRTIRKREHDADQDEGRQ